MTSVRRWLVALLASALAAAGAGAQTGSIIGIVTNGGTSEPLTAVTIQAIAPSGAIAGRAVTDISGRYRITNLAADVYTVTAIRIGFRPVSAPPVRVSTGVVAQANLDLSEAAFVINPVIVTASRTEEKALDAPASVSVIPQEQVNERPSLTAIDHVRAVPGVDVASGGMLQSNVVARGFNNVFSGSLLTLTDNRFAFVPSLRVNVPYMATNGNEDIERVEVVLGPGAALYGPNAANGVMHVITRSPFDSRGTTVTVDLGGRNQTALDGYTPGLLARTAIRHAGEITPSLAYKVSLERFTGDDWRSVDLAEQAIGVQRDFYLKRTAGEGRLDYRFGVNSDIVATFGRSDVANAIEPTGLGAAQVRDWTFSAYQLRGHRDRLFAQVFLNQSDAGRTFLLRNRMRPDSGAIVDRSSQFVAQIQHGRLIGTREDLIYGLDFLSTNPKTDGTINGRNEDRDDFTQVGGYIHGTTTITDRIDFVAAIRADQHSRVDGIVYSPRAAIVFRPAENQNIRLTYNRAFDTPSTNNQSLDLAVGQLPPSGTPLYSVRTLGTPEEGFGFRRDCVGGVDGLCMRSPFSPGSPYQPAKAVDLYNFAVNAVLSYLTPSQQALLNGTTNASFNASRAAITTQLRVLNPTNATFRDVLPNEIRDLDAIRPTITNAYELGYKGILRERLNLQVDLWKQDRKNFVGPLTVETPNVFLDRATLQTFLAAAFQAEGATAPQAAAAAAGIAPLMAGISGDAVLTGVPVGVVNINHALNNPTDIVLAYRNFGNLKIWGADVAVDYLLDSYTTLAATYSFTNKSFFDRAEIGGVSDIALNAPRQKGSLAAQFHNDGRGISAELRDRYVAGFPMNSGVYIGTVPTYNLVDLLVSYRLRRFRGAMVSLSVTNAADREHVEYPGGGTIGRLIMTRLQYTF